VIVFQANFPSAILERVLAMEADRFASLSLSQETINQERQTVLSERMAKVEGSLHNKVAEQLNSLAFPSHPYGRPTYGQTEELKTITVPDCEAYFRQYFVPQNMVLVIAGDVPTDQVKKWIDADFKCLPVGLSPPPRHVLPAEQPGPRRLDLTFAGIQDQLVLGWIIPEAANPDLIYLRLLSRVLESRFKLNGLTPSEHKLSGLSLHASVDDRHDAGLFIVEINSKWSPELADPLQVWSGLLENAKDSPVTQAETEFAKSMYIGEMQWALDGAKGIAERVAYGLCYENAAEAMPREEDAVAHATAENLNRVWKTYLISNHRSGIVVRGGSK
jgi:zinc protease